VRNELRHAGVRPYDRHTQVQSSRRQPGLPGPTT